MAFYTDRDINISTSGELQLDLKGDLNLAESPESHINATNFLLKTDNGQYKPNPALGANLGVLVGQPMNDDNLEFAEILATRALRENIYSASDVKVTVLPFDQHEAVCVVEAFGTYLVSGEFIDIDPQVFTYTFPFLNVGSLTEQITGD